MTDRRLQPRRDSGLTRWLLLGALLVGLAVSLGLADLLGARSPERGVGPPALPGGERVGPVLEVHGDTARSVPGDAGLVGIALVDGPPSEPAAERAWVETAAALARHEASATWFVSGRGLLEGVPADAAWATGGEVGITSFSGRDLAGLPGWRQRLELSSAQAALASRVGVTSPLLLLPLTPTAGTVDHAAVATARLAAGEGYALVAGAPPEDVAPGGVAVIPLDAHAAARIDALAQRLASDGVRLAPVSSVAGLDPADVNPTAPVATQLTGWVVSAAMRLADLVAGAVDALFLPLAVLMVARVVVAVVLAGRHARRADIAPRWTGPVTVIVPAYNEAAGIATALRSLVASDWRHGLTVVVVDDGSTDATASIVAGLHMPKVTLIRQANQGKSAALNAGLAVATTDVVVMVDGDTVFEPGTLAELVAPFSDPRVGASSGNAKVLNRGSLLGRWQHIEYVMGFNLDRRLLASVNAIATVPGAVGAFRAAALHDVGGVSHDTLAEDTDLTIAVQRAGWRVAYQARALAWTEAPATVGDLWRQRYRWCYGTMQAVWKHRRALVEPRPIGIVGLPYALTFQVVVALLGPVVDIAALYAALTGNAPTVLVAWLAVTVAQVALAAWSFRLDGERVGPLWAVPLQQLVYRQLMYLVVVQSVAAAVAGTRLRWHKLRRLGLAGAPAGVTHAPRPVVEQPVAAPRSRDLVRR